MEEKPFRGLTTLNIEESNVLLTGIPYDEGCSCGSGASLAPKMIRELSSYLPPLSMDGDDLTQIRLYDTGDLNKCDHYFDYLKKESYQRFLTNKFNIFIGGDHSVSIPLQASFLTYCREKNKIPAIIHLDAHPDICEEYDGSKFSHACTNKRSIDAGYHPKDITLIGIRGFEQQEVDYFQKHPEIKVYTASFMLQNGIEPILKDLLEKYDDRYAIYLSYDIDINDPSFAPGTGTPEAFGPSSYMVMQLITSLFEKLPIQAFDIVEVSPKLDCNSITSWLALKTLYEVFKKMIIKQGK